MMMLLSQGETGARGSSGITGQFGPGGNTGASGAKGEKGLQGRTVSNTVGLFDQLRPKCCMVTNTNHDELYVLCLLIPGPPWQYRSRWTNWTINTSMCYYVALTYLSHRIQENYHHTKCLWHYKKVVLTFMSFNLVTPRPPWYSTMKMSTTRWQQKHFVSLCLVLLFYYY